MQLTSRNVLTSGLGLIGLGLVLFVLPFFGITALASGLPLILWLIFAGLVTLAGAAIILTPMLLYSDSREVKLISAFIALLVFLLVAFAVYTTIGIANRPIAALLDVQVPETVTAGDNFTLTISLQNNTTEAETLNNVNFPTALLTNVAIDTVAPAPFAVLPVGDQTSYVLALSVPPGETRFATFTLTALNPAQLNQPITICVNTADNCAIYTLTTTLTP